MNYLPRGPLQAILVFHRWCQVNHFARLYSRLADFTLDYRHADFTLPPLRLLHCDFFSGISIEMGKGSNDPAHLFFFVSYIFDIIQDELQSLFAVELKQPTHYYYYIRFDGEEKKRNLFHLQNTVGAAINSCPSYSNLKNMRMIMDALRKRIVETENLLREHFGKSGIGGDYAGAKNDRVIGGKDRAEIGKQILEQDKTIIPTANKDRVRSDGFPTVMTYDYPEVYNMVIELKVQK